MVSANDVTVLLASFNALTVKLKAVPALALDGADTAKWTAAGDVT
jgi:hypothetical protein